MGVSGGPDIIQDGLVLSLDASDRNSYLGSGTIWRDMSGNNYSGSLLNSPPYTSGSNSYFTFDGVDDVVSITTIPNYNLSTGTINMWLYPTGGGRPFMQYNDDTNRMAIIYDNANQRIEIFSGYSTLTLSFVTSVNSALLNTWIYVSYLYDFTNDLFQIYINGVFNTSTTNSTVPTPAAVGEITLAAGKDFDNPFPYYMTFFPGRIANTSFYNRVLSASEILQNYNALKSRFNL